MVSSVSEILEIPDLKSLELDGWSLLEKLLLCIVLRNRIDNYHLVGNHQIVIRDQPRNLRRYQDDVEKNISWGRLMSGNNLNPVSQQKSSSNKLWYQRPQQQRRLKQQQQQYQQQQHSFVVSSNL